MPMAELADLGVHGNPDLACHAAECLGRSALVAVHYFNLIWACTCPPSSCACLNVSQNWLL
jgi:hypothetical protein